MELNIARERQEINKWIFTKMMGGLSAIKESKVAIFLGKEVKEGVWRVILPSEWSKKAN